MPMSQEVTAIIVILNVIVAIPGMYEWHYSDQGKERDHVVGNYNTAVSRWRNDSLEDWSSVQSIAVYDWVGTDGNQHVTLNPVETDEATEKGEGTLQYDPLRYVNSDLGSLNKTLATEWRLLTPSLTFTTSAQSIHRPLLTVAVNKVVTHNTSNWKQCQHTLKGSVHGKRCLTYQVLSFMCILFEHREQPGGAGLRWVVAGDCGIHYQPIKVARYDGVPNTVTLPDDITIIARHMYDPFLVAHSVTNGTLKFGRSPSDRQAIISLSATLSFTIFTVFICINAFLYFTPDIASTHQRPVTDNICIDEPIVDTNMRKRNHHHHHHRRHQNTN